MDQPRHRFELQAGHARAIAQAVAAVPGVAHLYAGAYNENGLLFPGERVLGLRRPNPRTDFHLEVAVAVDVAAGIPLADVASAARAAAFRACTDLERVDVRLADAV